MNTQDTLLRLQYFRSKWLEAGLSTRSFVTEFTYLLFVKMLQDTNMEEHHLPSRFRWCHLVEKEGVDQLIFYQTMLIHLGAFGSRLTQSIFDDAQTSFVKPLHLFKLVRLVDEFNWYDAKEEGLLEFYDSLLSAPDSYVTDGLVVEGETEALPVSVIDAMVEVLKPEVGEVFTDPNGGSWRLLGRVDHYIKGHTDDHFSLSVAQEQFQRQNALSSVEYSTDSRRLAIMNSLLHDNEGQIDLGDILSSFGRALPKSDVILSSCLDDVRQSQDPYHRTDFTHSTYCEKLASLQHIYGNLNPGGRAAVVVLDELLTDQDGKEIRQELLEKCNVHTIWVLPEIDGFAHVVNILFFTRGEQDIGNTKYIQVCDLRSNQGVVDLDDVQIQKLLQPCVDVTQSVESVDNDRMFTIRFDQIAENEFSLGFRVGLSNGSTGGPLSNGGTHAQ